MLYSRKHRSVCLGLPELCGQRTHPMVDSDLQQLENPHADCL